MTTIALGTGGEFDRIRRIAQVLGASAAALGDDTAVIPAGAGTLLVSTDASTEGVHFRRDWLAPHEIGWRAASAALSDLAASGALASGLVVAVSAPAGADDTLVVECMRGVGEAARSAGCRVLGGDLTAGPVLALTVTVFGHAARAVSRVGAAPGDSLWVTGTLGGARAALRAWEGEREPPAGARIAFAHPVPRLRAGAWLAQQGATAMLDISDGLAGDAEHLAAASGVALEIDLARLPIHPSVHAEAAREGEASAVFAAAGGEDYELLVAMPAGWDGTDEAEPWTGTPIRRIGEVVAGEGVTLRLGGDPVAVQGYRHG
ncbi:MAG: thiamine-phosphate kinase [Gemmatimonadales bacterium]